MLTNPQHIFAARCPHGHRPPQIQTLRALRDPRVLFYCELCARVWAPAPDERKRALEFAEGAEYGDFPPAAA